MVKFLENCQNSHMCTRTSLKPYARVRMREGTAGGTYAEIFRNRKVSHCILGHPSEALGWSEDEMGTAGEPMPKFSKIVIP